MNNQNHRMKMNTAKASARKFANADSPENMILPPTAALLDRALYGGSPPTH
jgi:hypothetical protein